MATRQERLDAFRKQFEQSVLSPGAASSSGGAPSAVGAPSSAPPKTHFPGQSPAAKLAQAIAAQKPKGLTSDQVLAKEQGRAPAQERPFSFFETDPGKSAIPAETRTDLEARYSTYDKATLPSAITGGFLPSSVVAEIRPENIDWEKLAHDNQWLSPTDALQGWMGRWKEIGTLGKTDPVAARAKLVEFLKEREASPLTDAAQMFHNAATDAAMPGADVNQRAPGTGVGQFANVAGAVAGMLGGNPGGAQQASEAVSFGLGTSRTLAKAPQMVQKAAERILPTAAFGVTTEAARQTAEAAKAKASGGQFDDVQALKEIGTNAAEYAGYGAAYGAISPVLEKVGEKIGGLSAVAKLAERFPKVMGAVGHVAEGATGGALAGLSVGAVKSGIQEATSGDPDIKRWIRNTLTEGGQEASEELVEGLAQGLAMALGGKPVHMPANIKAQTETEAAAPQTEGAPAPAPVQPPKTNEEEYQAAVDELLQKYLAEKNNQRAQTPSIPTARPQRGDAVGDAQALMADLRARYPDASETELLNIVEQTLPDIQKAPDMEGQVANVLDLTPERRAQYHAKNLETLQVESAQHEASHQANVQSIAEQLARDVTVENEATRKALWTQINERGKIKPYEDGRLAELTKRIPAHLKNNTSGVTLDQIATDLGYESDEALARDILDHANMKPVKAQDFLISAEKFYAETDHGKESHGMRDYYRQAQEATRAEINALKGGNPVGEATAQTQGAAGAPAQTERPGMGSPGEAGGEGTSGEVQTTGVGTTQTTGGASSVESDPFAKAATYVAGIKAGDAVSLAHVREAAGVSQGDTGKVVKSLMDQGLIANQGGKWVRTETAPAPSLLAQAARVMRNQRGAISIGSKSNATAPLTPAEKAVDAAVVHLADKPTELQKVISDPKGFAAKARDFLVDQFFNDKAAVGDFQKAVTGGQEVNADKDALRKMELLPKVAPGKTEAKLEELGSVLKPLGDKLERFWRYMDARVAIHRADRFGYSKADGNLPMERADAQAFLDEVAKGPDAKLYAKAFADLQAYSDRMLDMLVEAGMLTADGKVKIKQEHPDWAPWYRDQDAYNAREAVRGKEDVTRDSSGVQAGAGRSPVNTPKGILEQHGSDLPLMDPMERWIRYTARVVGVAERNKVGLALAELSKLDAKGEWMVKEKPPVDIVEAKVSSPGIMNQLMDLGFDSSDLADPNGVIKFFQRGDKDNPVVTVWRDGKQEFYRVKDARLYDAIAKTDAPTAGMLGKLSEWSQALNNVIRHTATSRLSFPIANLIRDTASSFVLSHNQKFPGHALVEAFTVMAKGDPFVRTAIENGLKQGGYLRPEKLSKNMAEQVVKGKTLSIGGLWEMYQKVREAPEFWTRLGEASLEYKAQKGKGADEATATLRALHEGGRITLNFHRKGAFTRNVNRHVAFFSIPFEVATRTVEAAAENPGLFWAKAILPNIALAGLVAFLNHDNDRYLQASDDERDRYWLLPVGKGFIRVPKDGGLTGIVANTAERSMRHWLMGDPEAFRGFWGGVWDSSMPRTNIPGLELLVGMVSGFSLEEQEKIVPYGLQDLSPGMQSTVKTPPSLKAIGEAANVSPVKMEWGARRLFGGYYEGFTNLERAIRSLKPEGDVRTSAEMPALGPEGIPLLGTFVSRPGTGKQGRDVSRFYDRLSQVDTVYNDLREQIQRETKRPVKMDQLDSQQAAAAQKIVQGMTPEKRFLLQNRKAFQSAESQLNALRRRRDALLASDRLTAKQKRDELEKVTEQISTVATRFMGWFDEKEKGRE